MKNYIRVTSEFTAGGIQMNIFIFSKDKNSDDIYIITLLELMDVLEYQSRIV